MRWAARLLFLAAVAACTTPPVPSPTATTGRAIDIPAPGRPYGAEDVLQAMRTSPRPGGVPDELETDAIAAAVAEQLWTYDGTAWPELVFGGSCGPASCTLEAAGTPPAALGEDLYVFTVTPGDGSVELADATLRGLPANLLAALDTAARETGVAQLEGMSLLSARWLPPPDDGRFVLAYRSGGEEGSCSLDVTLDARSGRVVDTAGSGC